MGFFNRNSNDNSGRDRRFFESSLRGNAGIPGTLVNGEPDWLGDVKTQAMQAMYQRRQEISESPEMNIMHLIQRAQVLQQGHEEELEQIAENVIRNNYNSILDGVELDIKLVRPGQPADQLEYDDDEDQQMAAPPEVEEIDDEDIKFEIDKRKIANNITQGEAKNTHRLIHHPDVREAIDSIHPELFEIYDKILKISEYFDWTVPLDQQVQMIKNHPEGMGGSVKVDWGDDQEEPEEKSSEDIVAEAEASLRETESEMEDEVHDTTPTIHSRGIDFPMLIHETVKGIYELISSAGIPEDEQMAQLVIMNADTLSDEVEDLRYGPFMAAQLRDFINENPKIDNFDNMREHVFSDMIQMEARDFLALMKGVLMNTDEARGIIDELIDEKYNSLLDDNFFQSYEDEEQYEDNDFEDVDETVNDEKGEIETDYSQLSQKQLQSLLDNALDAGDFKTAAEIGKFLD